ncbi:hypothetical protein DPMN_194146 [Dreissena polymorpha]|uniref:Uncharacterized protein n=1 Tax=Dreissena polymorpha TaxID=45954 RepID=A0A9D3Y165_DREPO|nr:hypothetical protein DPMN_194146 [Dreissena polymorpha]
MINVISVTTHEFQRAKADPVVLKDANLKCTEGCEEKFDSESDGCFTYPNFTGSIASNESYDDSDSFCRIT